MLQMMNIHAVLMYNNYLTVLMPQTAELNN